jgi:metacaspase-1
MTNAISIHIGLNRVDPSKYEGWDGQLNACEADANSMEAIAKSLGYSTTKLLTKAATADAVMGAIKHAASTLKKGDICLVTNSSHGGQVPDKNGDEPDHKDETWVMFDREIVDDELYSLWAGYAPGVRIVVLSDSCHSGTVTRAMPIQGTQWEPPPMSDGSLPKVRAMPDDVAARTYETNKAMYDAIQKSVPSGEQVDPDATVLLISGCQDNQTSLDGTRNGLFTSKLLDVWGNGKFEGSYRRFHHEILELMPPTQSQKLTRIGTPNPQFTRSTPFSI